MLAGGRSRERVGVREDRKGRESSRPKGLRKGNKSQPSIYVLITQETHEQN